ncbi:hypothetical protein ID80_004198 [Salmonella enterica subsp. enterica serovar Ball]|nr:hypothetical protein [Salmonella enterica subsp. enterica serovar Ball]
MWSEMTLSLPPSPSPVICRERAVHPWDVEYGHTTPDGCYLSPANALSALAGYLDATTPQDVIVVMVCDTDIAGFAARLAGLAAVLPLPALSRTARRAATQITHAITRMQIPAAPVNSLPPAAALQISTLQTALNHGRVQQAMAATGTGDITCLKSALADFRQQRQTMQQRIAGELSTMNAAAVSVSAFIRRADDITPADIARDFPHPASSLTYAHLFTGDLSGMMAWFRKVT